MESIKQIVLVLLTFFLISCSSEDSTPIDINAQEDDLVGAWALTSVTQDGEVSTEVQGITVKGDITSAGKDIDAQIVFTANPNNYSSTGGYTDVINISVIGLSFSEEEVVISVGELLGQGSWSINQGILTLTQNTINQSVNITELTTTSLKLELEIKQDVEYQGTAFNVNSTVKMTLVKQ